MMSPILTPNDMMVESVVVRDENVINSATQLAGLGQQD